MGQERKSRGKWIVKATKEIHKTPWLTIEEDRVIRPDGNDGTFTRMDIKPGMSILPLDKEGNVYLAKAFMYAMDKKMIVPFSGGIEKGEEMLAAAKRELREESGLSAKKWTPLGIMHDVYNNIIATPEHMFLAEYLTEGEPVWDGGEDIEVVKMPLQEAVEKVMKGEITQAAAQTIILKTQNFLKDRERKL